LSIQIIENPSIIIFLSCLKIKNQESEKKIYLSIIIIWVE